MRIPIVGIADSTVLVNSFLVFFFFSKLLSELRGLRKNDIDKKKGIATPGRGFSSSLLVRVWMYPGTFPILMYVQEAFRTRAPLQWMITSKVWYIIPMLYLPLPLEIEPIFHHPLIHLNPTSFLSLPAAVVGGGSGQLETALSTSSMKVAALCTVVPPRTTLTPGEEALIEATILASS